MMRIALFLFTNLAVMSMFSIVLSLLGFHSSNASVLILMSGLCGCFGSLISLLMSKNIILRSVNGKIIERPISEMEQWLLITVRHQAQQVNIITPNIAVYPAKDINAFATGIHKNNSLIAVSTGLLESMTRDESEAVIAHEISHIVNGDMVTMTLIQGIINTFIVFISRMITKLLMMCILNYKNSNNTKNSKTLYLIISIILEVIFSMIANIIVLWFSRYREFIADANSAKLVGKDKMIAALKRLKTSYQPKENKNIMVLCIHGDNKNINELFMSHPLIDKRIQALRMGTYLK